MIRRLIDRILRAGENNLVLAAVVGVYVLYVMALNAGWWISLYWAVGLLIAGVIAVWMRWVRR